MTKKSYSRWKNFPNFSKNIFNKISLALPQNIETIKYLKILGVKNIKLSGNLKYFGEKKFRKINQSLKNKFKKKVIWCAASTHPNEELFIGKIHKKVKLIKKNLLTIIIPRHINRSDSIIDDLKKIGLNTITHSSHKKINKDTDIYLVDTYGEANKFYELSNLSFLGGSLIPHGGQNPLEPARLGNYILYGPNIKNFKEIYLLLKKLKISSKINDSIKMEKILLKKIHYKQSALIKKKLLSLGDKILKQNLIEISKYI